MDLPGNVKGKSRLRVTKRAPAFIDVRFGHRQSREATTLMSPSQCWGASKKG